MSKPLIIAFVLIFIKMMASSAQDTLYYNFLGVQTTIKEQAAYYDVIIKDGIDTNKVMVKSYYSSGNIKSESAYTNYAEKIHVGKVIEYYENGQIYTIKPYVKGSLNGQFQVFWPDGIQKRVDVYKNDTLLGGACYARDGSDTTYYLYYEYPMFPGGDEEMYGFLNTNIYYPQQDRENGVDGTVYVKFMILKDGSLADIQISRSVSPTIDKEVIRVISIMPKWIPAKLDGEPTVVFYEMPVFFKLL